MWETNGMNMVEEESFRWILAHPKSNVSVTNLKQLIIITSNCSYCRVLSQFMKKLT